MKVTPDLLFALYWEKGLSTREITTRLGYSKNSHKSIRNLLAKFGVPIRNRSEAYFNALRQGKKPASFELEYTPWNKGITAEDDPRIPHGEERSKTAKEIMAKPEVRERISKALKGVPKSEEHCKHISEGRRGIIFSEEHKEKLRQIAIKQKPIYYDTSIEVAVQQELELRDIHFETHSLVRNNDDSLICRPDIVFPEKRLAVFCDGIYWHSMPHTVERDRRQERQLTQAGWQYLRFTGEEINQNVVACVNKIIHIFRQAMPMPSG